MRNEWIAFFAGIFVGAVIVGLAVLLIVAVPSSSVYKNAICNNAGYLEAVKIGGVNGEWYCVHPILDVPGLQP